ncbi:MAG TPA: hypothetical protein VGV37_01940 [Aliidongia sp.]|uniref:hypothetical protein n=1 Tax=Aliidongia sp. TaxID=1914230 RepID=UPI002DDD2AB5|nr:hypothetical protein [Aliidongia sp.]HEV2673272.1 hypothetical protein [Aliidongia sp.]
MSRATLTCHEGEAYRITTLKSEGGAIERRFAALCGACNESTMLPERDLTIPPIAVRQKFGRIGWIVAERNARHNRCPNCQGTKRDKTTMAAPLKPVQPTGPTIAQMFQVGSQLDDHFDEKAGRYEAGWTDERISTELNIPRAFVAQVREEGPWGKIRSFDDLDALKAEAGTLKGMIADFEKRVIDAERKRVSA